MKQSSPIAINQDQNKPNNIELPSVANERVSILDIFDGVPPPPNTILIEFEHPPEVCLLIV